VARRHTQAQNPQVYEFDIRMLTAFIPFIACQLEVITNDNLDNLLMIPHLGGFPLDSFYLKHVHVYPLLIKRGWLENHPTKWMFTWENPSIHEGCSSKQLIPRG
jgi:hypothetical protein